MLDPYTSPFEDSPVSSTRARIVPAVSTVPPVSTSTRPRIVQLPVYTAGDLAEVTVSAGGWDTPKTPASSALPLIAIAVLAFLFLNKA